MKWICAALFLVLAISGCKQTEADRLRGIVDDSSVDLETRVVACAKVKERWSDLLPKECSALAARRVTEVLASLPADREFQRDPHGSILCTEGLRAGLFVAASDEWRRLAAACCPMRDSFDPSGELCIAPK